VAVPAAATRHRAALAVLTASAIKAARRAWRQFRPQANWQQQYDEQVGPQLLLIAAAGQLEAVRESDNYVPAVLNELAFGPKARSGVLNPNAFLGYAGDGRPITGLLGLTVTRAATTYDDLLDAAGALPKGAPTRRELAEMALGSAQDYADLIFNEIIAETARAAESAATVQREWVEGYVRMLNPEGGKRSVPCSRCVILAGKFYLWNDGFERHPLCRCIHIPWGEKSDTDPRTNPSALFDSLSEAEQDKAFTKAGAQAIRDGADMNQVVNARRGMAVAGHRGSGTRLVTSEGATRRGWYGGGYAAKKYGYEQWFKAAGTTARNVGRRGAVANYTERRTNRARLMPEQIYQIAGNDHGKAIELLRQYGYFA